MSSADRLKSYFSSDPNNPELACELIDALFAEGRHQEVLGILDGLVPVVSNAAGVRFRRSRLGLLSGTYEVSENVLQQLVAEGHHSAAISHDIAFAQLCQRRTRDANATLDATVQQFGDSAELSVLRARVALIERDYARAQAALKQALLLEPGQSTAWGLQALGSLDAGETERAENTALACLALHPDQHEALLAAGTIALWRQNVDAAEGYFRRALSRFPNSGRALSGYAQALMLRGLLDQAKLQLEQAVVAMPDHIGTWHALAWVQLLLGDGEVARVSYERAYALDRNFAETHGGLATIAMLDGRISEGEESMRRALKLDPKSFNGRYARSLWLESQGETEAANALMVELTSEGGMPGIGLDQVLKLSQGIRDRAMRKPRA